MAQCKCCEREMELRLGFCFDCVEAESIILDGVDMYDKEIPKEQGMSKTMSDLRHILKKFEIIKNK